MVRVCFFILLFISFSAFAGPPRLLKCLVSHYSGVVSAVKQDRSGRWYILMKSGFRLVWDDGQRKNEYELLNMPDLQDMFHYRYSLCRCFECSDFDGDPGRVRVEEFFKAVYGKNEEDIKKRLVKVHFAGRYIDKPVLFNSSNGAAVALKAAGMEIDKLPSSVVGGYLSNIGGTFKYRKIKGTDRLSMHSFGIAIDFNTEKTHYWRWSKGGISREKRCSFPQQIISIMEKHGFIWGGKWKHYDSMHFEYRPELTDPNCGALKAFDRKIRKKEVL